MDPSRMPYRSVWWCACSDAAGLAGAAGEASATVGRIAAIATGTASSTIHIRRAVLITT
jgi:hypothetical protein